MTIETDFLNCSAEKLEELCGRIEACLAKLTPDEICSLEEPYEPHPVLGHN